MLLIEILYSYKYYFFSCFAQACQKTCYQRHVIERCGCFDAYFPADNASAFNYAAVPVCSVKNITQGAPLLLNSTTRARPDPHGPARTFVWPGSPRNSVGSVRVSDKIRAGPVGKNRIPPTFSGPVEETIS